MTYENEPGGTRTHDLRIKSPLLYQLSYRLETLEYSRKFSAPQPPRPQIHRCRRSPPAAASPNTDPPAAAS
jgi:hypothetical protein